jgi:peroxiredoxin
VGLAILLVVGCRAGGGSLAPGNAAPSFSLPHIDGGLHSLDQYRGKVVLLNFWATWCAPCLEELPALERLYGQLKDRGVTVLAVGTEDERDNLKRVAQENGITFPILIDTEGIARGKYKVAGLPESFVLDAEGKLVFFQDSDGAPTVRIIGPRDWDSKEMIAKISQLLPK